MERASLVPKLPGAKEGIKVTRPNKIPTNIATSTNSIGILNARKRRDDLEEHTSRDPLQIQ